MLKMDEINTLDVFLYKKKYSAASYRNIGEVIWAETGEEGTKEFIRTEQSANEVLPSGIKNNFLENNKKINYVDGLVPI